MNRKRTSLYLPEDIIEKLEEIKEKTGISVSKQVELILKGLEINERSKNEK